MGVLSANAADAVRAPGNRQGAVRGLAGPQLRALLKAMPDTAGGMRDRAITIVMVLTGLRRTEVLGMRAGDLSRSGTVYYSVRVKGGHHRRRELPAPAFRAVQDALAASGQRLEAMAPVDPLFRISSHGFYANLRRYAVKAGVESVTPHVLRHSASAAGRRGRCWVGSRRCSAWPWSALNRHRGQLHAERRVELRITSWSRFADRLSRSTRRAPAGP